MALMDSIFRIFPHMHPLLCVSAVTPIRRCHVYSQSLDLDFATWHALSMGFEQTCCKQRLQKTCFSTTACECFLVSLLDSERCMHRSSALQLHLSQVSPQRQFSDTRACSATTSRTTQLQTCTCESVASLDQKVAWCSKCQRLWGPGETGKFAQCGIFQGPFKK